MIAAFVRVVIVWASLTDGRRVHTTLERFRGGEALPNPVAAVRALFAKKGKPGKGAEEDTSATPAVNDENNEVSEDAGATQDEDASGHDAEEDVNVDDTEETPPVRAAPRRSSNDKPRVAGHRRSGRSRNGSRNGNQRINGGDSAAKRGTVRTGGSRRKHAVREGRTAVQKSPIANGGRAGSRSPKKRAAHTTRVSGSRNKALKNKHSTTEPPTESMDEENAPSDDATEAADDIENTAEEDTRAEHGNTTAAPVSGKGSRNPIRRVMAFVSGMFKKKNATAKPSPEAVEEDIAEEDTEEAVSAQDTEESSPESEDLADSTGSNEKRRGKKHLRGVGGGRGKQAERGNAKVRSSRVRGGNRV